MEDRRNVGESSCNSGDGADQRVQSLMFMMMMWTFEVNPERNSIRKWVNILSIQNIYVNYKEPFRTSQRTHGACIIKTSLCCTVD